MLFRSSWGFHGITQLSLDQLQKPTVDSIMVITLARKLKMESEFVGAYVALALRDAPLSGDEAQKLGYNFATKMATAREKITRQKFARPEVSLSEEQLYDLALRVISKEFGISPSSKGVGRKHDRPTAVPEKGKTIESTGIRQVRINVQAPPSPTVEQSSGPPLPPSSTRPSLPPSSSSLRKYHPQETQQELKRFIQRARIRALTQYERQRQKLPSPIATQETVTLITL